MQSSTMTATGLAAIAIGSNLSSSRGTPLETVEAALQSLGNVPDLTLLAVSRWYQTAPIGPPQPDYINGCALVQTAPSFGDMARSQPQSGLDLPLDPAPQALLVQLLNIEQQFGRTRTQRWGPRTLDLDLLLYNDVVQQTATLTLPHPRMTERAFVLIPLAELLPDWIHPVSGLSIRQLCAQVDGTGVSLL